jgi:hypothetical protein
MIILGCLGAFALLPATIILNGWVLSVPWKWFMVPFLHLPPLTLVPAIRISIVITMLTNHGDPAQEKRDPKWLYAVKPLLQPVLFLATGWIVKQFI